MKKTLLVIVMAFIGQQSMGQVQAGSIFVTGFGSIYTESGQTSATIGGTTTTVDNDKFSGGSLGLGGGYFLTDNIAVGLGVSLTGDKWTPADTSDPELKTKGFGIGVFARYYVPMSDNFFFFGQLSYNMMTASSIRTTQGTTVTETEGPKMSTNMIGISPGFTFFPTENIGLDLTFGFLGWTGSKTTSDLGNGDTMESKTSGIDANFDLSSVTFGIQYFFGGN
ncbi:MAG: outer membrane beta-barrel protein [Bacteroidia bacterium]